MKLITFDIFDTALLRLCGTPEAVFHLLARRLFPEETDLQEAFVLWRRQQNGTELKDIYSEVNAQLATGRQVEELMKAEKEVEAGQLIANPAIKALIKTKRDEGYVIAFVSDMYLDSEFLHDLLLREGCAEEGDRVYVSCEHGAQKATGKLYDVIRGELHPDSWEHYGDNRRSDYLMARRKGVKAHWVDTRFNSAEAATAKTGNSMRNPERMVQLASLSRIHRLRNGNEPYSTMAADFVAPAYLPYLLFILGEARRRSIKRIYFLSRDSYVLLRGAQAIQEAFPEIELRYLFVSRRSLLLPYMSGQGREAYLDVSDCHTIVRRDSIDTRLSHLGTNRKEMSERWGIKFDYDKANNLGQQEDFLNKIFDSEFTPTLQQRAATQEKLLMDYFRQEGLFDGVKMAAVDLGWFGTARLMMNNFLHRHGVEEDLETFYYGVRNDVIQTAYGRYATFYSNGVPLTKHTSLFEHYYSAAPYPTTIGYIAKADGLISPMFPEGEKIQESKVATVNAEALEAMAVELVRQGLTDKQTLFLWANSTFKLLTATNTKVDFTPMLESGRHDDVPFVKRLSLVELFQLLLLGKHVTGFNRASIRVTLPRPFHRIAWLIHRLSYKVRCVMLRKLYGA